MTPDAKAYFLKDRVVYKIRDLAFHMEFLGGRDIDPQGEEPQATRVNYLVGNREQDWSRNLATYKALAYRGIYPGIDARFGFSGSRLKSEFIVAPGGDPSLVRVRYSGLGLPQIEETGDLKFVSERGEFREELPAVYQMDGDTRMNVPAKYKIWADGAVGFDLGAFNGALPLIIDPLVVYSSYFGVHGDTAATSVAVDSNGNAYVAGWTDSLDLPVAGPIQAFNGGNVDAFVMKLNSAGNVLLYATYIGGSGDDRAYGIAVDAGGNAYVTGTTASSNFPTKVPLQSALSGPRDAFVLKLNAAGNNLTFSTFLGGAGSETGFGIALDTQANAYVTGDTTSSNFPTRTPFQASLKGAQDAFVTKISSAGALVYSTYLGGTASEHGAAIAVDSTGDAYVTGGTYSTNFPTLTPFQAANGGAQDAFVTKLGPGGNSLIYSTYLGGNGGGLGTVEWGAGIAVDVQGHAFVVGATNSSNFPLVAAFQPAPGGALSNAFVSEFNVFGTGLVYSTYFGGSTSDYGQAIAVDLAGNAYVTGFTGSLDIPIVASAQAALAGGYDAFVLILNSAGSALSLSTYYGGSGADSANGIAVDPSGNAVVAGQTTSANFPILGGIQSVMLGSIEAFVVKLHPGLPQPDFSLSVTPNPASVTAGGIVNLTVTSTGVNRFSGSVSLTVSGLPSGATANFSPTTITGSGSTTMTVTTTAGVTTGTFTLTVTGTSGSLVHTSTTSLTVGSASQTGAHVGVFESGIWLVDMDGNGQVVGSEIFGWGVASDTPVVGDWNGSGRIKAGVFRDGLWYLDLTGTHQLTSSSTVGWGQTGDLPVVGDWNHSGSSKIGVFRNGVWYLDLTGNHQLTSSNQIIGWGQAGDVPVVGDWNGDGTTKIGVFRNGVWYLDTDGSHQLTSAKVVGWGQPGDTPVIGDWNGDGKTKIGVFRTGLWTLDLTGTHQLTQGSTIGFGQSGDLPVVGDWNNSGTTKIGVYRSGVWILDLTGNHQVTPPGVISVGKAGDKPEPGRW